MDVRKLRGAFLRFHYSLLRLIAANEDILESYQEMARLIGRLIAAGRLLMFWKNSPMNVVSFLQHMPAFYCLRIGQAISECARPKTADHLTTWL